MNTPIKSLSDKILAIFFSICLVLVCVCLLLCIRCLREYHIYTDNGEYAKQYQLRVETESLSKEAVNYYYCTLQSRSPEYNGENAEFNVFQSQIDTYKREFSAENSNMFFEIVNSQGETVFGTKAERGDIPFQYSCSYPYMINYCNSSGALVTESGIITAYVADVDADGRFPAAKDDGYSIAFRWIDLAAKTGILLFVLFAIVGIAAAILIGVLLCSAGTLDENGKIISKFNDRVPLDLYAATVVFLSIFAGGTVKLTEMSEETLVSEHSVILIVTVVISALVIALLLSVATRIKLASQDPNASVFKNTLIYKLFDYIRRKTGAMPRVRKFKESKGIGERKRKVRFGNITTFISIIKFLGCLNLVYFSYLEIAKEPNWKVYILIWIIGHVLITPLYFMLSYNLDKLKKSWQNLAEGKLDESIDSDGMFGVFRDISKNLENVRQDIIRAYDTEAKSQLLRNELIANVSHDIKTPLTSIVSYVGLLKKDESISKQSREYIDVLDYQAEKLNKLLKNLLEASMASSGDVKIEAEPTDVRMLLEQSVAEFSDSFKKQHLIVDLTLPQNETMIYADGHHMWRIFENLMSNICKYAQEGTSVLLSLEVVDKKAVLKFKNHSKYSYPDGDSNVFLERFVRGDSSRHTEGNGLGLSIASNLTLLQNGSFDISTSENCFCVEIAFDIIPDGEEEAAFADTEEANI